jgi:secreted Zn-dependent insulinase-like peptidase
MFSHFFKDPLFPRSALAGAINAIEGEFKNNL